MNEPQDHQVQENALTLRTSDNVPSSPASTDTGIEGLELEPGEFLVAVDKPGAQLWMMVVIFGLICVTLPLAIWLFMRTGKYYVVTNRRSIRVARNGEIQSLAHEDLEEIEIQDMIPFPSFGNPTFPDTLKLVPTPDSGASPLVFATCSRFMDDGFTRLWGALHYWVRHPKMNIDDAPAVNADGELVDTELGMDVILIPKTDYGIGGTKGVLILTDTWMRLIQESTDEQKVVRADFPAYSYLHSLARRSNGIDDFLQRVDQGVQEELMIQHVQSRWSELEKVKMSMGSITAKDRVSGSRLILGVPKPHRDTVKEHMEKLGVL